MAAPIDDPSLGDEEAPPGDAVDAGIQIVVRTPSKSAPKRLGTFATGGLSIAFKDLTYKVPNGGKNAPKGSTINLLQGVAGFFEPRQMAALMGPSGSGKTTLLDVLAGRKNAGKIEGIIRCSGHQPSPAFLRRYTGYVEQFDTLIPILSVYEMLMYTAEMKRPKEESLESKQQAVEDLLTKLALAVCRDVKIGSQMAKGISGGQAKRTNIGIALITNPRVLFLDEPTSGLDSYTSNEVMVTVKQLIHDDVTICATIHSPTSYCFSLFDKLMMLVRGRIVYFGKQGHAAIEFARSVCPDVKEYVAGYNDAEYLVDLVTEADHIGKGGCMADFYESSSLRKGNDSQLEEHLNISDELPEHIRKELEVSKSTVTPWWWGIKTLIKYRTAKNYKDGEFLGPRIGDKILISLLIMTLYLNIGKNFDQSNLINMCAVLFMWVVLPAFGAASYVPSLVLERNLFTREKNDGLYLVITYLLYKMVEELFLASVITLPVAAWTFYGIGLQGQFVLFWLTYLVTLSNGIVLAYFIASFAPNLEAANALLPTYVVTLLFFAGMLFKLDDIPRYWYWYSFIDFLRYAWGALMVNQFTGHPDIYQSGQSTLEFFSLDSVDKWTYLGYESLFFIFFFLCTLGVMTVKRYQIR